jgi:cyanate permease
MRSMSPIVTPMLRDLDMSCGDMGAILGSWQLVYIPFAVLAGVAMDRWGMRKTLFAGAALVAISGGVRYFATGFGTLLPMVALFGVGGPLISVGAPKAVATWFRGRDRGVAVGIYTTAPWLGGFFAIAATNALVMPMADYSWRLVLLWYGLLAMSFAVVWGVLARDVPQDMVTIGASTRAYFLRLLRVRNVVLVLAAGLMALLVDHGFSNWLPKMLEDRGFTPEASGFTSSIPFLTAVPAVFLIPRLIPHHRRGLALALLSLMTMTALLLSLSGNTWLLRGGLALYGLSTPTLLPLLMLLLMDDPNIGPERMGLAGGLFFAIAEIGGFAGPLMMGEIVDATGVFWPGVTVLAGGAVALAVLMMLVRHPKH